MLRNKLPKKTVDWCQRNGWTDPFYQEGKYWAYLPGGNMPLPLPVQPLNKFLKDFAVLLLFAGKITAICWLGWEITAMLLDGIMAIFQTLGPVGINILLVGSYAFAFLSGIAYAFAHKQIVLDKEPPLLSMALPLAISFTGILTAAITYLFGFWGSVTAIGAITNGILFVVGLLQAFKFAFFRAE